MNWREAKALLDGEGKKRGPRDSLKIARNTYLERGRPFVRNVTDGAAMGIEIDYPENAIGLRLHGTYVAILTPRWTELYTGGWYTMTTADRMRYVANVGGSRRGGWEVVLWRDDAQCWRCDGTGADKYGQYRNPDGSIAHADGRDMEPGGQFEMTTCANCNGSGKTRGLDHDNGHPYFDGIRISADGKRLMRSQPHKPARYRPVYTTSGW